jgi:hypothetical protein
LGRDAGRDRDRRDRRRLGGPRPILNGATVYVAICLISACAGGYIGARKGSSLFVWFMVSGVVPILGPLCAALYRHETDEAMRICPGCRRVVRHYDALCMSCGTDLEYPAEEELIEPHPQMRVRARL